MHPFSHINTVQDTFATDTVQDTFATDAKKVDKVGKVEKADQRLVATGTDQVQTPDQRRAQPAQAATGEDGTSVADTAEGAGQTYVLLSGVYV